MISIMTTNETETVSEWNQLPSIRRITLQDQQHAGGSHSPRRERIAAASKRKLHRADADQEARRPTDDIGW